MEQFKCNKCKKMLSNKQALERHANNKKKCNLITEFKCDKCNKCFTQKKNLVYHKEKNICKEIINTTNTTSKNEKTILDIIESKISIESKIKLIKVLNISITDDIIIEILNNDIPISAKINLLNSNSNPTTINNTTNNNNTNNNTNNIQINNFGSENLDYINNGYLKDLIKNIPKDQNIGGEYVFLKLSNKIYLNDEHPENNTIKIDNLKNDLCKIKNNNKWITSTKDDALKNIFDKLCTIVKLCIDENKDEMPEKVFKKIDGYIELDFTDKYAISSVKKLAFDIYNYYNATEV